jgi:hypothetical protein
MNRRRSTRRAILLPSVVAGALLLAAAPALAATVGPPEGVPNRRVCPGPFSAGAAGCHSRVVTDRAGTPLATAGPTGYGPAQFHTAYELPTTAPTAQTIAIVDAYDNPTIEEDLRTYSETFGLPECTTANGCFNKINQEGQEGPYPKADQGWALEIALDVETAHAICQSCTILLVEASSSFFSDLSIAVDTAASLGADEISNSYGGTEYAGEVADTTYKHPGIAITASAGDEGYGAEYPAASPYVIAVGGTKLTLGASNSYGSETAWSGTGSGCSAYALARSWQTLDPSWSLTGCGAKRGVADVAADAAPESGASVYDTTKYFGQTGWFKVGGTSLSAPLIAAVYALAGGGSGEYPAADPYAHQADSPASLHDVTSGSNGSCGGTIMCEAAAGYDGPTGVGTPKGLVAFGGAAVEPEEFELTVSKGGEGEGTVTSSPAGIDCGSECSASFEAGTEVTLTASPAAGSEFGGWTACDAESEGKCEVTMSGARAVEADFGLEPTPEYPLTVTVEGTGAGTVVSDPAGIECSEPLTEGFGECLTEYEAGTEVTLTASPAEGSEFVAWMGCDSEPLLEGVKACVVTISEARAVEAEFGLEPAPSSEFPLAVTIEEGEGTVVSDPAGIECSEPLTEGFGECLTEYEAGTQVTLTASPGSGYAFRSWRHCLRDEEGDGPNGRQCTVTISEAEAVSARFLKTYDLTVSKLEGSGPGKVSSRPAGIACLPNCSSTTVAFWEGKEVELVPTPAKHFHFAGWSGDCSGSGSCTVSMTEAHAVEAAFAEDPKFALTLTKSGGGQGKVRSDPAAIFCSYTCSTLTAAFYEGEEVVLSEVPGRGSTFAGWVGCDSVDGEGRCVVAVGAAREVAAEFE